MDRPVTVVVAGPATDRSRDAADRRLRAAPAGHMVFTGHLLPRDVLSSRRPNSQDMRLVLSCLPSMGGSAITTVGLASALAGRGHEVHVVSTARPFAADTDTRVEFHWPRGGTHPVLADGALAWLQTAQLIGTVARDVGADIVNPHYLGGLLPATALAVGALAPQAAVVGSAHGTDVTDVPAGTEALTAALLQGVEGITAVSGHLARMMETRLGVRRGRTRVIANWIEPPPAPTPRAAELLRRARGNESDSLLLVHASNFRPVKRAARCIDALTATAGVTSARLLLVGDGPDLPAVLRRAHELGVADRVEWAGVTCPDEAYALLAGADLALLPSESEACSGVLLQALAAGVPSVAYDVAGNPGVVVHGGTGVLVRDEPTADRFARAVADLAADPARRRGLAEAGQQAAAAYTKEVTVTAYEKAYGTAVARRTRRLLRAA